MSCAFTALVCACIALGATENVPAERSQAACSAIERGIPAGEFDHWEVAAMAWRESRFDPSALGRGGEIGLLQVKPRYVRDTHSVEELYTLDGNVSGALRVMRWAKAMNRERWHHCYAAGTSCSQDRAVNYAYSIRAWLLLWARKRAELLGRTG